MFIGVSLILALILALMRRPNRGKPQYVVVGVLEKGTSGRLPGPTLYVGRGRDEPSNGKESKATPAPLSFPAGHS